MRLIIVIPAYNEEKIISQSLKTLYQYCQKHLAWYDWNIVVSDNASQDATKEKVLQFVKTHPKVEYFFTKKKGKGLAIRSAWEYFSADVYCFMDADLATHLSALPVLVDSISKEHYDVAYGSRFHRDSHVQRSCIRKFMSLGYRILLKWILRVHINDAPCGFKAISHTVKKEILPLVLNNEWFFDSELVIIAENKGFPIKEISVIWEEPKSLHRLSKVKILPLIYEYVKKTIELRQRLKRNSIIKI